MENLRSEKMLNEDLIPLVAENKKLRKEILVLRIFVICLVVIQLYNIFLK